MLLHFTLPSPHPHLSSAHTHLTLTLAHLPPPRLHGFSSDGFTWKALHTIGHRPCPREGHAASLVASRYLVVHGGYDHETGYLEDTHVLDTQQEPMVWTRPTLTGARPRSVNGHSLLGTRDDELVSFGGMSLEGYEMSVHILQLGVGNEKFYPGLDHERH